MCEIMIEVAHEAFFFKPLLHVERHAGVEIPNVPAVRDRHVASIGFAGDEHDPVFAEQAICIRIIDEAGGEELLLHAFGKISRKRGAIFDPAKPDAGMRAARPHDDRKLQLSRNGGNIRLRLRGRLALRAAHGDGCGNIESVDTAQQPVQLVAIEVADKARQIEQRPRPARRHGIDLAQRLGTFLRIRRDHDRHVVFGKRRRQIDAGDDVECLEFDAGFLQQEFDRGVAAHVDRRSKRQHAQFRPFKRTGRTVELMKGENFRLDRHSRLLVTQKLRDQRQVEALARACRPIGKLLNQLVPQRAEICSFERHRRQSGKADPVCARITREFGRGILTFHGKPPLVSTRPCRQAVLQDWRWRDLPGRSRVAGCDAPSPRRRTRLPRPGARPR